MAFPYDLEDEDQELAMLDDAPYDSISSRPPLPDTSSTAINPAIKAKIQERMGSQMEDPDGMALKQDRDALLNKQAEGNIFQALSGFSKGGSTPTSDEGLYRNIAAVKQQEMTNLNADAARREKIKAAIAAKQMQLEQGKLNRDALGARQTQQQEFQAGQKDLDRAAMLKAAGIRTNALAGRQEMAHQKELTTNTRNLTKDLAPARAALRQFDNVEKNLGFKLEDASTDGGVLKVNGKEVDLPGFSIQAPLIGGRYALGERSRKLQTAAQGLFNSRLSDVAGANVVKNEMQRIELEFGKGAYNDESDLIQAMKDYKTMLFDDMKDREAGYPEEAVQLINSRGGRTTLSKDSLPMSASSPTGKTVKVKGYNPKTNQTQIVYTDGTKEIVDGRQ